jgi:ArsR family transcriptional regulator
MAGSTTTAPRRDTDELARALKILADPNRLRILDTLLAGTQCNCDLGDRLGMAPNLISHHLGILKRSGLVHAEKDPEDARWIHYSVDREAVEELKSSLSAFLDTEERPRAVSACGG